MGVAVFRDEADGGEVLEPARELSQALFDRTNYLTLRGSGFTPLFLLSV